LVTADNKVQAQGVKRHLADFSNKDAALVNAAKVMLERGHEMMHFVDIFRALGESIRRRVTIDEMLHPVLGLAGTLLSADRGDFIGPGPHAKKSVVRAQWGPPAKGLNIGDVVPRPSFMDDLLKSRRYHAIGPDTSRLRHYHVVDKRTRSELAFKFQTPQGKLFLFNLESFRPNFFEDEDARLLALILPYVQARVAQAEGRETVALYKDLIVDHLQEMVFVKDVEGRFVFVCQRLAKFLGAKNPTEVVGKTDRDFFKKHPEMVAAFLKQDRRVMKSGQPSGWFHEPCQPDCQPVPWQINTLKAPVFASDGIAGLMALGGGTPVAAVDSECGRKVVGVIGIFHDVSREAHLKQAQSLARAGCIVWHKKTDLVDVSNSIWDIFEVPARDRLIDPTVPVGLLLNCLIRRIERADQGRLIDGYIDLLRKVNARGKSRRYKAIRLTPPVSFKLAAKPRWLRLSYENRIETEGDPDTQVVIVVVQDVTELEVTIRDLRAARDRLIRANQSLVLGALSRASLHDARRPIDQLPPAVDNMTASLRELDGLTPVEQKRRIEVEIETLEMLKKECIMARDNIEHLRELSKDEKRIRVEKVDLIELLKECEWVEGPDLRQQSITVRHRIHNGERRQIRTFGVRGDKLALRVAFGNLVRNAILSGCPEGSAKRITITVGYDRGRKGMVVQIRDSGPGFSAEIIQHIKEPFSVAISPKGMGFGLLIAKTLFSLMQGEFEPLPGPGARCRIFLPQFDGVSQPTAGKEASI
jgi:signal transduction histidine kinase/PAS domain-containing protein